MATTGLDTFDRSVQKSNEWLKDLMERLGTDDRRYAYRVLRAHFHLLRDRLTVDEAAQLAAQLPHLLRGVFYEGWDPSRTPETYRHREEFLSRLAGRAHRGLGRGRGRHPGAARGHRRGGGGGRAARPAGLHPHAAPTGRASLAHGP
jgi:hypothetical protein